MIFFDQLSLRSFISLLRYSYINNITLKTQEIYVLDTIPKDPRVNFINFFCFFLGLKFKNVEFFCGDYRDPSGESLWSSSKRILNKLSFDCASKLIKESNRIGVLNSYWGSNTILLHLGKKIFSQSWYSENATISKILASQAIAEEKHAESCLLFLAVPELIDKNFLSSSFPDINLILYKDNVKQISKIRFNVLLVIIRHICKRIYYYTKGLIKKTHKHSLIEDSSNLLVLQSDELSLDRTLRTQPHWLFNNIKPEDYKTYILQNASFPEAPQLLKTRLSKHNIDLISECDLYGSKINNKHLQKPLLKSFITCLLLSFFGSKKEIEMSFYIAKLFEVTFLILRLCEERNIKAILTAENFPIEADAIQLIKKLRTLKTISFQYSNMSETTPVMMNVSDIFLTFSDQFQARWKNEYISPKEFKNIGYCFDSSFTLLEKRSSQLRSTLHNKGVDHILCYFDESVQDNKYGVISLHQYTIELEKLSELILDNANLALIIKPQFSFNSSEKLDLKSDIFNQAIASGRLIELHQGSHRNNIFPAEAALSSDIAIGHAIGSTASLEAALVGCRSILINPYDIRGPNIETYEKAGIIYASIDEAISAYRQFLSQTNKYPEFGNWAKIIEEYDPFQDGQSSMRIKDVISKSL